MPFESFIVLTLQNKMDLVARACNSDEPVILNVLCMLVATCKLNNLAAFGVTYSYHKHELRNSNGNK